MWAPPTVGRPLNGGGGNWWGEGRDQVLPGRGRAPTICGTGTEDYFLGAYDWDVDGEYVTYNSPYAGYVLR